MSELSSSAVRGGRVSVRAWMAVLGGCLLGLGACQSVAPEENEAPPSLFLELRALTGEPVPGARVSLPSGEQLQSNDRGQLLWPHVPAGRQLLRVESPGFAPSLRALDVGEGVRAGVRLELLPLGAPVATFDTRHGTAFEKADLHVSVPPGDLFDTEGRVLQGEVEAYLAPLDLNDLEKAELLAVPGEMRGELHPGEPPVNLESLALMALSFQPKPGTDMPSGAERASRVMPLARRLRVRGNVPRSVIAHVLPPSGEGRAGFAPGTEVPLWRLDTGTGLWKPTGDVATVGADGQTYELSLEHPAPLLHMARPFADHPGAPAAAQSLAAAEPAPAWRQTACLEVRVEDEDGHPVGGRTVVALGLDYASVSRAVTGGDGRALVEVMRDRKVRLGAGTVTLEWHASREAGTCTGQGAAPTPVTLRVPSPLCVPGAARACAYPGPAGTLGTGICRAASKVCDVEGAAWSATCQGEVLPRPEQCDNTWDDNCDGLTNEDCPAACEPGEQRPCYEGPEETRDVGVCRGGVRTCQPGGTAWSACEGQVLPAREDCSRPEDENCDGVACQCWPGERQSCYGGPPDTRGVGPCQAGTRTCEGLGTGWSACVGEVVPQAEDCSTATDDDCNGVVNQVPVCLCNPGTSAPCYSGPRGTENVGGCQGGTWTCEPSGTAWGTCKGEVVPQAESCANATDDDCDGVVNQSPTCLCMPGTSAPCYSGPPGTKGVGVCHGGTQTCGPSGTAWGACQGERVPQKEICFNQVDEDCDGVVDEPSACSWPAAESMASPRTLHTATLLESGEVLIAGGDASGPLATVEAYDPASSIWSPLSPMKSHRYRHTATLMGKNKVLVAGGQSSDETFLKKTEIYDRASNTWTEAGDLKAARQGHTATLLRTGEVLVSGGYSGSFQSSAELYDSGKGQWASTGSMNRPRHLHTATLLGLGKVLVTGGDSLDSHEGTSELYDTNKGSWELLAGKMESPRYHHTATLLCTGEVLVTGGRASSRTSTSALNTAELYNTVTKRWRSAGTMAAARYQHTATLLCDGKVLVSGGSGSGALATSEVYDPYNATWSSAGDPIWLRSSHTATRLNDHRVIVAGGAVGAGAHASAELYIPLSPPPANTWRDRRSANTCCAPATTTVQTQSAP